MGLSPKSKTVNICERRSKYTRPSTSVALAGAKQMQNRRRMETPFKNSENWITDYHSLFIGPDCSVIIWKLDGASVVIPQNSDATVSSGRADRQLANRSDVRRSIKWISASALCNLQQKIDFRTAR